MHRHCLMQHTWCSKLALGQYCHQVALACDRAAALLKPAVLSWHRQQCGKYVTGAAARCDLKEEVCMTDPDVCNRYALKDTNNQVSDLRASLLLQHSVEHPFVTIHQVMHIAWHKKHLQFASSLAARTCMNSILAPAYPCISTI